jgi:predicted polyphosphate/ATP-dependent NAD kinase
MTLKPVGIIPNPASGKDIRRLVAYGSVFDNNEKVNIVRRVILGLDAMGVQEVFIMPDYFGIGNRATEDLDVSLKISSLEMPMQGTQDDSTRASALLNKMGAACIITLGGDGTNRAVAKACADTPLLPISTGTNNVFPFMVEGTLAGIAAGVTAMNSFPLDQLVRRVQRLEVHRGSEILDIALVDVVVSKAGFIATRAVWDVSTIQEIFLSRAEPGNIGFSSVGGYLCALQSISGKGVHIKVGPGSKKVKAPIAPGLIRSVSIESYRIFESNEKIPISHTPAVIAVDGERERIVKKGERLTIRINANGPRVVDIAQVFRQASQKSLFFEE